MSNVFTGGCLCGAIRYECTYRLSKMVVCHCADCRKAHAAPAGYNARVRKDTLKLTRGLPKIYSTIADSGLELTRQFCADCGSQLFSERANMPEHVSLKVGTLDDPSHLAEAVHIWTRSAMPWMHIDPELPQLEEDFPELAPDKTPAP